MEQGKLFRVLVIGGALLGAAACREEQTVPTADAGFVAPEDAAAAVRDAGAAVPDAASAEADAGAPESDAGALEQCGLCPNEVCCETDESGSSTLRMGFECCWGTSC